MDRSTIELVRRGLHPAQLALQEHHYVKYSDALELRAYRAQVTRAEREDQIEPAEEAVPRPDLRRVGHLPPRNIVAIRTGYFERERKPTDFDITCLLDYHAFVFDRFEYFDCKNPTCQLHMRRLQELNSRLKEDLERPRVKVAEASMSLINYCNQTRDYMVPSVWGQVDRKEDPYNPQSGGNEGCCSVM